MDRSSSQEVRMSEHENRSEEPKEQEADAVEDLEVPEGQAEQVEGGAVDMFVKIDP
jgi:hypothetical protein